MGDNGDIYSGRDATERVLRALEDQRFDWRTVEGVAEQVGVPQTTVRQILEEQKDAIVRSSIPDDAGRNLYTTRKHYRQTHGFAARLRNALTDKVA